jgi:eukaryotic-like serine/threonine-protein kinase
MTTPAHGAVRPDSSGPAPPGAGLSDAFLDVLAEQMAEAWGKGEPLPVEALLARFPELDNAPGVLRLLYEEMCLRQEYGQALRSSEALRRFPRWQTEVRNFLRCYHLLEPLVPPQYPAAGESLGDYQLLQELGQGGGGRVFLAAQPLLANRPVVLKLTPLDGQEHLSLARLQHTHVMPLYGAEDFPDRNLRALCMPYFGGATLAGLLARLRDTPPERRSGQQILNALDQAQTELALRLPGQGPVRQFLARASYVQAVCWVGACLAEALHYAHQRGLVHLDLKPANVLLAADGQPLLLDFHLAREPFRPGGPVPDGLGGTPGYMAPEQRQALTALKLGREPAVGVGSQADLFALAVVLYECLAGERPAADAAVPRLSHRNRQVTTGLADLIHKCLAPCPADRYPDAALVASDLRRHLAGLPLRGVANRNPLERWRKWRRRQPHQLALAGMLAVVALVLVAVGLFVRDREGAHSRERARETRSALAEARGQIKRRQYADAVRTLTHGLDLARQGGAGPDVREALEEHLLLARRGAGAQRLHRVADRLRLLWGLDAPPPAEQHALEAHCRQLWEELGRQRCPPVAELGADGEWQMRTDLLELAILWADLQVRQAAAGEKRRARERALRLLDEAEARFGPSVLLYRERRAHAQALGMTELGGSGATSSPRTAWEHAALARSLYRAGDYQAAHAELERTLALQPQDFWANFYDGLCSYRLGRIHDAVAAFRAVTALAPENAVCFYNRARAQAELGEEDRALEGYDRALRLAPALGEAALNRGLIRHKRKQYEEALADYRHALACGADPAAVHFRLALVHLARHNWGAAGDSLLQVLGGPTGQREALPPNAHGANP